MKRSIAVVAVGMVFGACSAWAADGAKAIADLHPTKGNHARGTVTFIQQGNRVVVTANVSGLTPGMHGFHIHEKGDCSAPDGMSTGGHFNPTGQPHGSPDSAHHHAGDMPELDANAAGNATLATSLEGVTIGSGPTDIVGRGVIIHAGADDFTTQPTGNSGGRVACGVIKKS